MFQHRSNRSLMPGQRFEHSRTIIQHDDKTEAEITKEGRVIIRVTEHESSGEKTEEVVDEVNIPASLIFKLTNILNATRRVVNDNRGTQGDKGENR